MNSYVAAFRAITAEYIFSLLKPAVLIAGGLYTALLLLLSYLAQTLSPWWWVFAVPFTLLVIVLTAIFIGLYLVARRLEPRHLTPDERRQVKAFTAKLLRVSEAAHTPYPFLLLIIAKDLIIHRESRFLRETVEDSTTLKRDFAAIKRLFK